MAGTIICNGVTSVTGTRLKQQWLTNNSNGESGDHGGFYTNKLFICVYVCLELCVCVFVDMYTGRKGKIGRRIISMIYVVCNGMTRYTVNHGNTRIEQTRLK